jgi:carboxypeptidase C (cathepsin A)
LSYFNQPWVLSALGVPLNFTYDSNTVTTAFGFGFTVGSSLVGTGDGVRTSIADFEYLLNSNVTVAMAFGDRDFRCPWLGGETTALAAKYPHASQFRASGYEKLVTNKTYSGGVVKQYDNFSFSRIFDAGHAVGTYQPETMYQIFMRSMFDKDVATGKKSSYGYASTGPTSSLGIRNSLPAVPPTTCMVNGKYQNETIPVFAALNGQSATS